MAKCGEFNFGEFLSSPSEGDEIVVTGLSGRFSQSKNVDELYEKLIGKKDLLTAIPDEWKSERSDLPPRMGRLDDRNKFDSGFFGAHHGEAEVLHPSCRMLLETTFEALMDAGLNPVDVNGARMGVFLGAFQNGFELPFEHYEKVNFEFNWLTKGGLAEKVSYYLGLEGPTGCMDVACGSSGYALNHAFRSIRSGECDSAIVAGANLIFTPNVTGMLTDLRVLDKDGENNVFGENAKGYVRSEGIFAIVLQKWKDSKRVYAQIAHTNTNSNGFNDMGMFHPSLEMQTELFKEVYSEAGLDPSKVDFIEVHSTGTKVGDLAEVAAIEAVFCPNRNEPVMVGSAKSNFGHSETASALSSLIKVLVGMEKNWMPPNINCANIRTDVKALHDGKVKVLTEPWCLANKTYFGLNNFGIGGNNVHVLVKKIHKNYQNHTLWGQQLVLVSGRTAKSVQNLLSSIGSNQADQDYLDLLRHTFRFDIKGFLYRGFAVICNKAVTFQSIKRYVERKPLLSLRFYGTNEHYITMGQELREIPIFDQELQKIFNLLPEKLIGNGERPKVLHTMAVQMALIKTLTRLDLPVDNVSGSAIGRAYAAGRIDAEQSVSLASQIFEYLSKDGRTFRKLQNHEERRLGDLITKTLGMTLDSFLENGHNNEKNICLCFGNESHVVGTLASFLTTIGRLYQVGFSPNLQTLYPRDNWPVKAPIISPLIDWYHEEDWFVPPPCQKVSSEATFSFDMSSKDYAYLLGHCIDGRLLLGGMLGLTFVWQLFAKLLSSTNDKVAVSFENVKWHRPLVLLKNSNVKLTVQICKSSKRFVVTHSNDLLITGSIQAQPKYILLEPPEPMQETDDCLQRNTFYTLMNFRHYCYSDQYVGVEKVSSNSTQALIKWGNNWTVFIDHMSTLIILHERTKDLMLLSSVASITIDPQVQMEKIVPAHASHNIFRSPAADVRGLVYSRATKRPNLDNPTLLSYQYVPYQGAVEQGDAMRIVIGIVVDNVSATNIHVTEVLDDEKHSMGEEISEILASLSTTSKVSKVIGHPTEWQSDLMITYDQENLSSILHNIKKGAFVLVRQPLGRWSKSSNTTSSTVVVSTYHTQHESFVLLRKTFAFPKLQVVRVSNGFSAAKLESCLNAGKKILLLAEEDSKSGILGLINSLEAKYRGLVLCVFVIGDGSKFDVENAFYKEQLSKGLVTNVLSDGKWGIYLQFPVSAVKRKCDHAIGTVERGNIKSLRWVQGPLGTSTTAQLVGVSYAGLNYHDAMVAIGKINPTFYEEGIEPNSFRLGMEYSGRNLRGEKVMGLVRDGALSNLVEAHDYFTWKVPHDWSLEDAATVPCAYTIALYTLKILGRVKPGHSVLVHAGSGGIGQACLNTATFLGCTIFTTVGSREKMRLLKKHYPTLHDTHIGSTHDTSFEQLVMKRTRGRGVDVIINCLPEEKFFSSLRCLSRGGKLFDISNFDALKNENFDISNVNDRVFYEITLHGILNGRICMKQEFHKLIGEGIRLGYVKPLLRLTCDTNHVEEALQFMATSRHLGKVVVKVEHEEKATSKSLDAIPKFYAHPAKVYLFSGELDGFGVELADWLITRGVRNMVIACKENNLSNYQRFKIRSWKECGARVVMTSGGDLTISECESLINEGKKLGEIDGVFHVMIGENATTLPLQNLDSVTRNLCPNLGYFVNCSSTSIGGGTYRWLVNAVVRRICEDRQSKGFPALAMEWGPIDDLQFPGEENATPGLVKQKLSSCLQVLDVFLTQTNSVVSSFIPVKVSTGESKDDDLLSTLANIIGIDMSHISLQSTLSQLGMDSISSVEIKQFLEEKFKIVKSFNDLRNITLAELKGEVKN